jgi:DNA modification methylase
VQTNRPQSSPLPTRRFRLSDLRHYPGNARRGDVATIKACLRRLGLYRPVVVNARKMEVLAGNHVVRAARELGWNWIDATVLDVDDDTARRIVVSDNGTSDLAGYDDEALTELLLDVGDLEGTGFDRADLDALLDQVAPKLPLEDEDLPPAPSRPITKRGELVLLGQHRLFCGDARDRAGYERLLGEERAGIVVTDPPWGVGYEGKTKARLRIENDHSSGLDPLLREGFACIDHFTAAGSPLYVFFPAGPLCSVFLSAFMAQGWLLRQMLVWAKDAFVLSHADYHFRHEGILYGFKPGTGRLGRGGAGWFGDNRQCSVFDVPRPRAARDHPTTKPPELLENLLRNSSRRGALVLDPFAGSGSTLVACERLGRKARVMELDPRYADVVIERFERLTGTKAERLGG